MPDCLSRNTLHTRMNHNFLKVVFLFSLLCCFSFSVPGQRVRTTLSTDSELLSKNDFHKKEYNRRHVRFLLFGKNPVVRFNPVSLAFGGLMYFYQKIVSPQISAGCSYEISCSNFSKKCIVEFGLIKGIALSSDRLMRCNGIAAYDIHQLNISPQGKVIDPPDKYRWKRPPAIVPLP